MEKNITFKIKKISLFKSENILSMAAAIFGVITLFASSAVLLGYSEIFEKDGNYPSFVLWGNLISGPLYLLAAIGFKHSKIWTLHLVILILIILVVGLTVFFQVIKNGGTYETETLVALSIRIAFTSMLTFFALNKTIIII